MPRPKNATALRSLFTTRGPIAQVAEETRRVRARRAHRSAPGGTQKGTQSPRQSAYSDGSQRTPRNREARQLRCENGPPPVPGRQVVVTSPLVRAGFLQQVASAFPSASSQASQ